VIIGRCGHANDRLDSGLLLISGEMQEQPIHAAFSFLMLTEAQAQWR